MKKLAMAALAMAVGVAVAEEAHWAQVKTGAYTGAESRGTELAAYTGYFCTVETAERLFGYGKNSVSALTDYLSGNYAECLAKLAASATDGKAATVVAGGQATELAMTTEFSSGWCSLKNTYSAALVGDAFLAMIFYGDGFDYAVRVMANDSGELADYGNAQFTADSLDNSDGAVGDWTASKVSVQVGKAVQRYPWNGIVDVPFRVRNMPAGKTWKVSFKVKVGDAEKDSGSTQVSAPAGGTFAGTFAIDFRKLGLPTNRGEAEITATVKDEQN